MLNRSDWCLILHKHIFEQHQFQCSFFLVFVSYYGSFFFALAHSLYEKVSLVNKILLFQSDESRDGSSRTIELLIIESGMKGEWERDATTTPLWCVFFLSVRKVKEVWEISYSVLVLVFMYFFHSMCPVSCWYIDVFSNLLESLVT